MKSQRLDSAVARWMKRTHKDFSRSRTGGRETPDKAKELFRRMPYSKGDKKNDSNDFISDRDGNGSGDTDCVGGSGERRQ